MGLFWSMARLPGEAFPPPSDAMMRPFRVRLEATSAEGVEAAAELERRVAAPRVTRQPIRTAGLVGTLFLPPGDSRFPTVIVVSGGGVIEELKAAVLASHDYAALALALAYFAAARLGVLLSFRFDLLDLWRGDAAAIGERIEYVFEVLQAAVCGRVKAAHPLACTT